jgi:hypothetical protein
MTLLVAGAFVGTFLVVCLIASLLLSKRGADPKPAATRRQAGATGARIGYGPRPAADAPTTRRGRAHFLGAGRMTLGALPVLAALVVTLSVVLGVIYGLVTAISHLDMLVFLFRGVPAVPGRFQWAIPPVLAAAILAIGLPLARRFRRPERFRTGVVLVALGVATFWPMQYLAASFDLPFWEYEAVLHGLAFFISMCLLSGGLETMRRASNTAHDDSWEFWRADL